MFRPATLLALTALTVTLAAEDFGPVVKAVGQIYPGKTHFGIVCNYDRSREEVADFQRTLPEGTKLTVVDVRHHSNIGAATSTVLRHGIELVALMPNDPLVRDGSFYATTLVHGLYGSIPAFGTRPEALKNGCALALGAATNWELMINPKLLDPALKGVIGPVEISPSTRSGMKGPASLDILSQNR